MDLFKLSNEKLVHTDEARMQFVLLLSGTTMEATYSFLNNINYPFFID